MFVTKCSGLPTRYMVTMLMFFGTCISYMLRANLSLTIIAMVNKTAVELSFHDQNDLDDTGNGSCPFRTNGSESTRAISAEGTFVWSSEVEGIVLSTFFYGYGSTIIFAGRMAELYGPKWLIGGGILLGSILTILLPLASKLGVGAIIVLRILTGMTQATVFPGLAVLSPRWMPPSEKTRLYCMSTAGSYIGIILSMSVIGWLCDQSFAGGWPSVYYTFGLSGIVWSIFWFIFFTNTPSESHWITEKELTYITDSLPTPKKKSSAPWKSMLTSVRVWSYAFTYSCSAWVYTTIFTGLPNFLDQALHVPIELNGLVVALTNCCSFSFSILGSITADFILNKKILSPTNTRKLMEITALTGCASAMLMIIRSGCDLKACIAWLCIFSCFQAFATSGEDLLPVDMASNFSGSLFGLGNALFALTGHMAPLLTGYLLSFHNISTILRWHNVFYVCIGVEVAGALSCAALWSAEPQSWNEISEDDVKNALLQNDKSTHVIHIN